MSTSTYLFFHIVVYIYDGSMCSRSQNIITSIKLKMTALTALKGIVSSEMTKWAKVFALILSAIPVRNSHLEYEECFKWSSCEYSLVLPLFYQEIEVENLWHNDANIN